MNVTQIQYIKSLYPSSEPNPLDDPTSFESRVQQIVCDAGAIINSKDYELVWDDTNELLIAKSIKKTIKGEIYKPISIYIPYAQIFYINMMEIDHLRENMLQSDPSHWGG
jgi:hypothetical protein